MSDIFTAAAKSAKCVPEVFNGVSYMTAIISSLLSAAVAGGLGWYVRGRGMAGVKIDMDNMKNEIEKLKNQITSPAVTPTA